VGRVARLLALALLVPALAGCGDDKPAEPAGPFVPTAAQVAAHNQALGLLGKYEFLDAVPVLDRLVAEAPRWADARVNLAIALLNTQDKPALERSQAELVKVLEAEPKHVRARYVLGLLRLYGGEIAAALPLLKAVAEEDPADAYAASWVAVCLGLLEKNEEALAWFKKALAIDPLLESAHYGAFQLLQGLDRMEEARAAFEEKTRLEGHPLKRQVDFKYSQMGPKALARVGEALPPVAVVPLPAGRYFAEKPETLPVVGRTVAWSPKPGPITTVDIDGDGAQDLFLQDAETGPDGTSHVLLRGTAEGFRAGDAHPLEAVRNVNTVLWGDVDNDGRVDAYFCRNGENALFLQKDGGKFENVTWGAQVGGGAQNTVDGVLADFDHDGDLDIYCVNVDGANELFSNNLDGTFRPLGASSEVGGNGQPSLGALAADLDNDRDLDLVVLHVSPPHEVFWNDRLWTWKKEPGALAAFVASDTNAVGAADIDGDGFPELFATLGMNVNLWRRGRDGRYAFESMWDLPHPGGAVDGYKPMAIAVADLDGDGVLDVMAARDGRLVAYRPREPHHDQTLNDGAAAWTHALLANVDPLRGPVVVRARPSQAPDMLLPARSKHRWAALAFSGKHKDAEQMRSNASGIGVRAVVQVGARSTVLANQRTQSGPGQSLQPLFAGVGPAGQIDFVSLLWPDGLMQTEMNLAAGRLHRIEEVQRQTSSCPVLFCWDGTKHAFVTDLLGVGGIGFLAEPGVYAPPFPREHVLLPAGLPVAKDGRFVLKVSEPMEETCYLDAAVLAAWDLPPGVSLVLDERMGILGPAPTSEPRFFRRERTASRATDGAGADVTALVATADHRAAPVGALDRRFVGRTQGSVLTLEFDPPLDAVGDTGAPMLVADGWIEYPYAQTVFAAWQAGAPYLAPTLEARAADGTWTVLQAQFGYPAGMPRRMSFPLPPLPQGTTALRLTGTYEIYWDRIAVAWAEPCPEAVRTVLPRRRAVLEAGGFAKRTTGPQRLPHYDWERRVPLWDSRHHRGAYTRFGDVEALLGSTDDAVVVFGPGEDVHLEYASDLPPVRPGWSRRFVLETTGWCKDMDLYTKDGDTVGPLPLRDGAATTPARDALHAATLTRPGR
jgi:tetratricopeptide (TPR) repeat protein